MNCSTLQICLFSVKAVGSLSLSLSLNVFPNCLFDFQIIFVCPNVVQKTFEYFAYSSSGLSASPSEVKAIT